MKNKALLRFFKTYLIFYLCVGLMLIPTYIKNYSILMEQELAITSANLKSGIDTLDNQIFSMLSLSQTSYSDIRYRELFLGEKPVSINNYVKLNQVQTNFTNLIGTQTLISDAGIVFKNGMILTRYRNFFDYNSYEKFFVYNNLSYDEWHDLLYRKAYGAFLPEAEVKSADYNTYRCIAYIYSWPPDVTKNIPGVFYITIDKNKLLLNIVSSEIAEHGFVRIYDPQNTLLLDHQYTAPKGYKIITHTSSSTGLKVEVGIPNYLISERLKPVRNIMVLYFIIMTTMGILLASIFAYRSSNPIRKIVGVIDHIPHVEHKADEKLSEFDVIEKALNGLDKTIDTYSQTIETQKSIIRSHIFQKAVTDGLHSKEAISDFNKFFPNFPESFSLAAISFMSPFSTDEGVVSLQVSLLDEIKPKLPPDTYIQSYGDSSIILVLPVISASEEEYNRWVKLLEELHGNLTDKYDMDFKIVMSECFSDIKQLQEAYGQIRNMSLLSDYTKSVTVCRVKDLPQNLVNTVLDNNNMQQLYAALIMGDIDTAGSILDTICRALQMGGYIDEIMVKQVYYNIRNILLRTKLENYDVMASITIPVYSQPLSINQLFVSLYHCCEQICSIMCEQRETSKTEFSKNVCKFITENISNETLYAKMVASHFGISETTLQKTVKAATGKTFFEYVEDLRLEKAYSLLKNSDMTINSIAAECGFSSTNSFYKAFKRRYKHSPSMLRN